ncbi:Asp-tRNA(Asn)/Glu-tRNA(Gln) amidotransferase subunit GatB [Candidatus Epulonipiscium viviparus]|uniref:Asp-tRNA(Asn)/Glu-tRNA(Gln) amidotransferase subunit GatB n=1 Tax=Candidatus Epulonipiscium viviparus TaxID=420336 RepID=UPI00016C0F0D|nr:Asp-tRNA(Asn)/Glu-tRNA(Gln) amidotransferase subunit GatB [Candidatus Epulopiscium viviparus]
MYEMVIGLEVHCELNTETKIFCGCKTTFGAEPNTQVCPVCMGMPGTLPVLNEKVVNYAIKAGLATKCKIRAVSKQDRKNYFYPDLPKAYQISQFDEPLCERGYIEIETEGGAKKIGITRIHIEEDAGKLIHDKEKGTFIDSNRCGVPLIEIVSEPDMRSSLEAVAYFKKLRAIILYTGISDCKMNEGSLRCDVNLSVRKKGEEKFGTRTEMKNLNSFTFIQKAIEYEFKRQVDIVKAGGEVVQETRRYDQATGKTYSMRTKEDSNDYRYFPDPDLAPIVTSKEKIQKLKKEIPPLPDERKQKYMQNYGLNAYDAELLTNEKEVANYFEKAAVYAKNKKILANLIITEVLKMVEDDKIKISYKSIADISNLASGDKINSSVAKKLIKDAWDKNIDVNKYVEENDLLQINDKVLLKKLVLEAIKADPKSVAAYKAGKSIVIKSFIGKIMGKTGGRANPVVVSKLLEKELSK